MLDRGKLLEKAQKLFEEGGYNTNKRPYRSASFDFIAKKEELDNRKVFIVKVIINLENFTGKHAIELFFISEMLDATPIVIGERSNNTRINDDVIYERHQIFAINLYTLRNLIINDKFPIAKAKRGGYLINISPSVMKSIRLTKLLSIKDVANVLNLSSKTIRAYEAGDAIPTSENAIKLSKLLGNEIFQPISLKKHNVDLPKENLKPKTELQEQVQNCLLDLSLDAAWFNSAPVDGICHSNLPSNHSINKEFPILTGVAQNYSKETKKRMNDTSFIAQTTNKQAFFVVEKKIRKLELQTKIPILSLKGLEKIEEKEELIRILKLN